MAEAEVKKPTRRTTRKTTKGAANEVALSDSGKANTQTNKPTVTKLPNGLVIIEH